MVSKQPFSYSNKVVVCVVLIRFARFVQDFPDLTTPSSLSRLKYNSLYFSRTCYALKEAGDGTMEQHEFWVCGLSHSIYIPIVVSSEVEESLRPFRMPLTGRENYKIKEKDRAKA